MIELENLCCPSCNATMTSLTPSATYAKCEYCGAKFSIVKKKGNTPVINEVPQNKLLIKYSREDFVKEILLNYFVNRQSIPDDIYDEVQFSVINLCILPYYYFEGSCTAYWNCEVGTTYLRQRVVKDSDGESRIENYDETVWNPQSGIASGRFSYLGFASGDSDKWQKVIPLSVKSPPKPRSMDEQETMEIEQDIFSFECKFNPMEVWELYVNEVANSYAECLALVQMGRYSKTCNKNITTSTQLDDKLTCYVHAPFWVAKMAYKEEEFYLGMFAYGSEIYGTPPLSLDRQKRTLDRGKLIKSYDNRGTAGCFIFILPLLLSLCVYAFGILDLFRSSAEFIENCEKYAMNIFVVALCLLPVSILITYYYSNKSSKVRDEDESDKKEIQNKRDAVAASGIEKYIQNASSSELSQ